VVRRHLRDGGAHPSLVAGRLDELVEEIAQHLEDQYVDALAAGMSPAQAEDTVLHRNADWPALTRAVAEPPPTAPRSPRKRYMESFVQDFRFSLKSLAARPLFTAAVVLLLAVGIGANTALFTVVNGVLFAPLPYHEADRLVAVSEANRRDGAIEPSNMMAANLQDLRARATTLDDVAGYWQGPAVRTGGDEPEMLAVIRGSNNILDVLGVDAALGTTFAGDGQDAAYTAVLGYGYWQRAFAGDPGVIGNSMTLDQESYTIVGVLPQDFAFLNESFDAFIAGPKPVPEPPIDLGDDYDTDRTTGYMRGVGRLAPSASFDGAVAEIDAISRTLEGEYPDDLAGRTFTISPLRDNLVGAVRGPLLLLLGAVGFVLLIACANVASLLLSRANSRRKEIAVRAALGASRSRVVRQLLTESITLAAAGGLLGVGFALLALAPLRSFLPDTLPQTATVGIDLNVLAFTSLVTLLTGIVFGSAPALQSSAADAQSVLRDGGRGASASRARARWGSALVVVEIALAVMLLIGAGLTLRSLMTLQGRDTGFEPDRVLTLRLSLPQSKYDSDDKIATLYWRLHDELAALPGVESAATVLGLPFSGTRANFVFTIDGEDPPPPGQEYGANFQAVSPDYFTTLGIPLLAGRDISRADTVDAPAVAIVNQALVDRHFAGVDPLTQAVHIGDGEDGDPIPIVGVVGSIRYGGYDSEAIPEIYMSFEQLTLPFTAVVVRAAGDDRGAGGANLENLIASVRAKVLEIDPDQPVYRVQPLTDLMAGTLSQPRFNSRLLSLFAAVALLLAAAGVFGVISYSVTQRTREFGIRMALGAEAGKVRAMVMRHGTLLAVLGITLGLGGAAVLARLVSSLWIGVNANDPLVFAAVPTLLALVALLASYLPARRATRVDPVIALRAD
jgi:putative ABC transport system permease protein